MSIIEFLNMTDTRTPCDVCETLVEEGREVCSGECEQVLTESSPMQANGQAAGDSTFLGMILLDDDRL